MHTKDMELAFGRTLPGAIAKASTAFEYARLQLAKLAEPAATAWLEGLANMLKMAGGDIQAIREGRWADFFTGRAAFAALHTQTPSPGGETKAERYLREISVNTGPQGPLGHATRGGGSFAEPGGGMHIRNFSQMFRRQ